MKKSFYPLWILFNIVFITACQYELSEDFYNDINLQQPSSSLSITNLTEGEILRESKTLNYNYNAPSKNSLYEIIFYINDNEVKRTYAPSGSLHIDLSNYEDGKYNLKIEYFFKTGSGSLAEISGNEAYHIQEEINFEIDKKAISLEIDRIENKEGTIYVYFNDFPLLNEVDNTIVIRLKVEFPTSSNNTYTRYYNLTKEDLQKGYYVDKVTVRDEIFYSTIVKNNFEEVSSEKKTIRIQNSFSFNVEYLTHNKIKLSWTKHPLYNNAPFISFSYYGRSGYIDSFYDMATNQDGFKIIEDPTSMGFGIAYRYTYRLQKENKHNPFGVIKETNGIVYLGNYFFPDPIESTIGYIQTRFDNFIYDQTTNKVFALEIQTEKDYPEEDNVYIHQFNPDNFQIERSVFITKTKGYYGSMIRNSNGNLTLDFNEKSLVIDPNTLSILGTYNGEDFQKLNGQSLVKYRNGIVIIDYAHGSLANNINLYNSNTKLLVNNTNDRVGFKVSPSGNYYNWRNKIYVKKNSKYELFYENESELIHDIIFNEEKGEIYAIDENRQLIILDINTKTKSYISSLPQGARSLSFDYVNNILLIKNFNFDLNLFFLYDFETNSQKSINSYRSWELCILNNFIVSKRGFYLKNNF